MKNDSDISIQNDNEPHIYYNISGLAKQYGVSRFRALQWLREGRLGIPDAELNGDPSCPIWETIPPRPIPIPPGRKPKR